MAPPRFSKKRKRVTDLDALPWIMGDDGIQEVEGVEVVRKGDQVEFLVAGSAKRARIGEEGDDDDDDDEEDGEEWGGIGDGDGDGDAKDGDATNGDAETDTPGGDDDTSGGITTETPKDSAKAAKKKERAQKLKEARKARRDQEKAAKAERKAAAAAGQSSFAALETLADAGGDGGGDDGPDVDMAAWRALELSPDMVAALARLRFASPTPIQAAAIPEILDGKDVIGKASTGSGKTLAFAIPVVERWLELQETEGGGMSMDKKDGYDDRDDDNDDSSDDDHFPTALVLSPTRELAHQITKHILALVGGMPAPPRVCAVTGGLSIYKQQRQLAKADIVVGTPGRLWEVLSDNGDRGRLLERFKRIRFLVVDEADRLLSEGHFKEAEEILAALDRVDVDEEEEGEGEAGESGGQEEGADDTANDTRPRKPTRQTLVFSATFNKSLQQKLAGKGVKYDDLMDGPQSMEYLLRKLNFRQQRPRFIDVNPVSQMAEGLREGMIECGAMEKVG
jgi:ATP-dependent RNA helicase DDX24/MAK5